MERELPPYKESWLRALERVHVGLATPPDADAEIPIVRDERVKRPASLGAPKPIIVRLAELAEAGLVNSFVATTFGAATFERVWTLTPLGEKMLEAYYDWLREEDEL